MADSITILLYFMMFAVAGIGAVVVARTSRSYYRNKKLFQKTPRVRGRNWLVHPQFGSGEGIGVEPIDVGKSNLVLRGRSGHIFKFPVSNMDIYPENPVHAFAGNSFSLWRFKGIAYLDGMVDKEKASIEAMSMELSNELQRQKLKESVAVNEAATLKDVVLDIIKEVKDTQKIEGVVIKK